MKSDDFLKLFKHSWNSYKYRFVPWVMFNLKNRKVRHVKSGESDKIIKDELVVDELLTLVSQLSHNLSYMLYNPCVAKKDIYKIAKQVMLDTFGYYVQRVPSSVGGTGVCIYDKLQSEETYEHNRIHEEARVPKPIAKQGSLVALYPGLLYLPSHPILLQSIRNPFIFKCEDGILVDGNDKFMSKMLFRSCVGRDKVGFYSIADETWLTPFPTNPLNVGQYVNNQNKTFLSNVVYQEVIVSSKIFSIEERKFIPNLWYSPAYVETGQEVPLKIVALVASREIFSGEELFSDYFTIIT